MVFKKQISIVILLFISVSINSICQADDKARDRATLRGIQSVIVKVHTWEPEWREELKKAGLEESYLQSLIERKLEKAGIPVLPEEAARKSETEGILNVRMKFLEPERGKKIYTTPPETLNWEGGLHLWKTMVNNWRNIWSMASMCGSITLFHPWRPAVPAA